MCKTLRAHTVAVMPTPIFRSLPDRMLVVARRLPRLVPALILSALGTVMTLRAHVGVAPWTVFHDGLHHIAPLTFGQAVIVTGLTLVAAARIAGIRPGVGTLINIVAVGVVDDALLGTGIGASLVRGALVWRALIELTGLAATGLGSAVYVAAGLGAGPRDSIQLAISRQLRVRPGTARFSTEALAVALGVVMGGSLGWGTAVAVVVIPPVVDTGFRLLRLDRQGRRPVPAQDIRRERAGTAPKTDHLRRRSWRSRPALSAPATARGWPRPPRHEHCSTLVTRRLRFARWGQARLCRLHSIRDQTTLGDMQAPTTGCPPRNREEPPAGPAGGWAAAARGAPSAAVTSKDYSASAARTFSSCSAGLTLRKTWLILPSASITKVVRSLPM